MNIALGIYISMSILICLFALFALYILISSRFFLYPPMIRSSGETERTIIRRVYKRIQKCENNNFLRPFTIIDAGCGIGTLIIPLAEQFPEHNFVGIEWSRLPFWIAKFRGRKLKNFTLLRQDMFTYDFSEATIIMCFLIGHLMNKFSTKVQDEIKNKSYIFSNRFKFNNLHAMETIDMEDNFSYVHIYKLLPKDYKGYRAELQETEITYLSDK